MPGRSPHRRSPPPPPLISRHSPVLRSRGRSPDRRRPASPGIRGRDRREFRNTTGIRRSRSPIGKARSHSPPLKRKPSPKRSRESSRRGPSQGSKLTRSKSPIGPVPRGFIGPDLPVVPDVDSHSVRSLGSDRFRGGTYEGERSRAVGPQFRGPEGSVCFDQNELKKIVVDIVRKPGPGLDGTHINRAIINPEEIAPVRRPDFIDSVRSPSSTSKGTGGGPPLMQDVPLRLQGREKQNRNSSPPWLEGGFSNGPNLQLMGFPNEGSRPIFMRPELTEPRERSLPPEEYRRIVAINPTRAPDRERERDHSHDRQRYPSPGHYERSRGHYTREDRSRSPIYESRHPSTRNEYIDHRDKIRDDRYDNSRRSGTNRSDLRHDLDVRRRDDERHYPERRASSYERESDLRSRIIEKRSEPHRRDERDQRLYESDRDREKHSRSHHPSPPQDRRRGSLDGRDGGKPSREMWEKEHESDRRRRAYSRERDEERGRSGNGGGRERYHEEFHEAERSKRFPYKPEFEPKMKPFYRHEDKEFIPVSIRGRGGPPMRGRGMPPMPRGRGMIRGPIRGFRGGPIMRGLPGRGGFMGMRGFAPRFFPPF